MGRRRTARVVERALKIYKVLLESSNGLSTPAIFTLAMERNIVDSYSALYQALKLLETAGILERRLNRGSVEWEVVKVLEDSEVRRILLEA